MYEINEGGDLPRFGFCKSTPLNKNIDIIIYYLCAWHKYIALERFNKEWHLRISYYPFRSMRLI